MTVFAYRAAVVRERGKGDRHILLRRLRKISQSPTAWSDVVRVHGWWLAPVGVAAVVTVAARLRAERGRLVWHREVQRRWSDQPGTDTVAW